jgi:hypothetical protein
VYNISVIYCSEDLQTWDPAGSSNIILILSKTGHVVAQCLTRCATSRMIAGSIAHGVTEIFN